jgi:hypothetical protein
MITPRQLVQVAEVVALNSRLALLRERFPALHFSECSADDVSPRHSPALSLESHDLYLVAGASGHCLELTSDAETATGILVAVRFDDNS